MVNSTDGCPVAMEGFTKSMREQMWRINALLIVDTALVVIHVGAGTYGRRYHRHSLTRFLFVGASPLFLPIVSSLVSTVSKQSCSVVTELTITCNGDGHPFLLLQWASLVQIVGASSSIIVIADDGDSRSIGPFVELLARGVWTSYLVFCYLKGYVPVGIELIYLACGIASAKIMLKFCAFEKARYSFALGRNSRLVAGYMKQLQDEYPQVIEGEELPPIVTGEEKQRIEEGPQGYRFIWMCSQGENRMVNNSLATLDKVRRLASSNDAL